jgi:hypothetical protein
LGGYPVDDKYENDNINIIFGRFDFIKFIPQENASQNALILAPKTELPAKSISTVQPLFFVTSPKFHFQ